MKQFTAVDEPYRLPDNLNLFSWSIPFLADKITEMLNSILNNCSKAELRLMDNKEKQEIKHKIEKMTHDEEEKAKRKQLFKSKIKRVG